MASSAIIFIEKIRRFKTKFLVQFDSPQGCKVIVIGVNLPNELSF